MTHDEPDTADMPDNLSQKIKNYCANCVLNIDWTCVACGMKCTDARNKFGYWDCRVYIAKQERW